MKARHEAGRRPRSACEAKAGASKRQHDHGRALRQAQKIVRIGGASGFWGDSAVGARQLIDVPGLDYLSFCYLAEPAMPILAAARARDRQFGYATDFVDVAMRQTLRQCVERGIRIVANAGGINAQACARAFGELARELGVRVKVAVVDGSDIMPLMAALAARGVSDLYSGAALPENLGSANARLDALPVARALDAGADVVITGCVDDGALVLGILIHEFDWGPEDFDLFAAGSLAGHIIECGCQATGGLYTDWERIPDWPNIGYPVIECAGDGSFVLTKPEHTGGLILDTAVAEQMLFEIGDPAQYVLPDVIADLSKVAIAQLDEHSVRVSGARGSPPTDSYKVSATWMDGYSCAGTLCIVGIDAVDKARRSGEAVIARSRRILGEAGLGDFSAWNIEVLGAEEPFGAAARRHDLREAVVRIVARHPDKRALELFAREIVPAWTSWSAGTTGGMSPGRPAVTPLIRLFTCTVPKAEVRPWVRVGDAAPVAIAVPAGQATSVAPAGEARLLYPTPPPLADDIEVPLVRIAWGRSGDMGDTANIGLIARSAVILPYLLREVDEENVRRYLQHYLRGTVTRYLVPGIHAINLVLTHALGGGTASMRNDPLGKGMAQILLCMPVRVPAWVVAEAAA